ncbi:hypothetical protein C8R44DRAFT_8205 [Mycena epipterygia]|nr:hypothetical protein C8R44DRAFT_8205 [Mycena epipterygia]
MPPVAETPVSPVTGYYRAMDIQYKLPHCSRPEVLPGRFSDPLKAVLNDEALVHPENPLHNGVEGITLFRGTVLDGEQKLLFSSAQVDYLRYWLHAMNLTNEIIPLPHSERLLLESEFSQVSPQGHHTGKLRNAVKQVDKNNKLLKGCDRSLVGQRNTFERVRNFWAAKTGVWCAMDFECWERENSAITEFGYSSLYWNDGQEVADHKHFTVKEHQTLRNGQYVPENRERYQFGKSVEVTEARLKTTISSLVSDMNRHGPVFLVFHDHRSDMKDLHRLEAPVDTAVYQLPDTTPSQGIFIVDTAILFRALIGKVHNTEKLVTVCNHLQIPTVFLHNAGNDAHYTLLALREMASGGPLDVQREMRWPLHTGSTTGVAVQLREPNSDDDVLDEEGGYNPVTGVLRE